MFGTYYLSLVISTQQCGCYDSCLVCPPPEVHITQTVALHPRLRLPSPIALIALTRVANQTLYIILGLPLVLSCFGWLFRVSSLVPLFPSFRCLAFLSGLLISSDSPSAFWTSCSFRITPLPYSPGLRSPFIDPRLLHGLSPRLAFAIPRQPEPTADGEPKLSATDKPLPSGATELRIAPEAEPITSDQVREPAASHATEKVIVEHEDSEEGPAHCTSEVEQILELELMNLINLQNIYADMPPLIPPSELSVDPEASVCPDLRLDPEAQLECRVQPLIMILPKGRITEIEEEKGRTWLVNGILCQRFGLCALSTLLETG
ncbi:Translation initiation factor IF-2 [Labeo rohita]|uniref:Translation initiation factor IF-2 n=1 Tax=Labeo rohita TaxID=84645 RepID=A0ABQ8L1C4_LABRO|nr:Translation initiation factor IF-2 [Labeo rohita]